MSFIALIQLFPMFYRTQDSFLTSMQLIPDFPNNYSNNFGYENNERLKSEIQFISLTKNMYDNFWIIQINILYNMTILKPLGRGSIAFPRILYFQPRLKNFRGRLYPLPSLPEAVPDISPLFMMYYYTVARSSGRNKFNESMGLPILRKHEQPLFQFVLICFSNLSTCSMWGQRLYSLRSFFNHMDIPSVFNK